MSIIFAEIVIDSYQDPTKRLFTYQVPDNLTDSAKEGAKVVAPFGKRVVEGYIWNITTTKPPFPTRPIQEIKESGFSKNQLKLAKWMAGHYLASPLDCLKCQSGGKGEKSANSPVETVATLLLVPSVSQVNFRAGTEKQKNVMIGSRSAVFAQLPNLKKIIIEEPENWNYKDERAPYYHAAAAAQKRAEIEGLEIELRPQNPKIKPSRIADLDVEKLAGNFTLVSQSLEGALTSGKYTIVYVNSRELRDKIREEIHRIGVDKNRYEIAGPELFSALGKETHYTVWADVDTLLNLPDFRAHEKIVWTVQKLSRITKGELILQTSSPQNSLFADLAAGDLTAFHRRDRAVRRELGYPPFSTLIKLSFSAKSSTRANPEAENLYEQIQDMGYEISAPYEPYGRTPGKVQLNLTVKIKPNDVAALAKLAKVIPPEWKAEVDPESLL
ncbi:MAG TPA: hypothetical protein VI794_01860 [Patescibacteria group bacterium]|nr:hypothetical protein [Patescibacteria group bacterium]